MATTSVPPELAARCERFLNGHGAMRPGAALAELAEAAAGLEVADIYGAGAVIEDFERQVAELLGKAAGVFMPTGTMAQLIAMRVWAERKRRRTVAWHATCHLELREQQSYQVLHGLQARLVGERHRLITRGDLDELREPVAALLLELPAREIGGQLPSWEELTAQVEWAREHGVALHMDGARLWEAQPFYERPYAEIAALFDTVYVSCYKALGGISGAVLTGPADFIAESRIWLKRHGGNVLHLFPYTISARLNLERRLPRLPAYHRRAQALAAALRTLPGVRLNPDPPQTRMFHLHLPGDAETLMQRNLDIVESERVLLFNRLRPTDVPGYSAIEIGLGDAADALTDAEVRDLFARVIGAC